MTGINLGKRTTVAVLGASAKPERTSHQAVLLLSQMGFDVFPVHPAISRIAGLTVYQCLSDIEAGLDTITVYLSPERSSALQMELLCARPRRVVFNPGAENPVLAKTLLDAGIEVLNACTLVLLQTGRFGPPQQPAPLRSCAACAPCFIRQAEEALTLAGVSGETREALLREIAELARSGSQGAVPPEVSQRIQRLIRDRTGCQDPYRKMKSELNQAALSLLPEVMRKIPEKMTAQEAAVRLSIGGNILDAGAKSGLEMDKALGTLERVFTQPLVGDWSGLFARTASARRILFLADNAGEIVFDRPLLMLLPRGAVTVAVRGRPVINDATLEDAAAAGISDLAAVMDNGSDAPGTLPGDCSGAFRAAFAASDLVIAKGQGNYETLATEEKPMVFLLQVKCPVIAAHTGAAVGTLLVRHQGVKAA
ncbi:MAG: ARMT1-like domain-containing protein [candidate division FCPU426 bacterium]